MTPCDGGDRHGIPTELCGLASYIIALSGESPDAWVIAISMLVRVSMGWSDTERRAWLRRLADQSDIEAGALAELQAAVERHRAVLRSGAH